MDESDTVAATRGQIRLPLVNRANFTSTFFDLIAYNMTAWIMLSDLDLPRFEP